jgi:hypothetical protein
MDSSNNTKTTTQNPERDKMMEHIRNIAPKHCDLCGQKYHDHDFNLVKTAMGQATLHLKCHNCSNSYLLNIYSPAPGMIGSSRSQMNLDVESAKELVKFAGAKAISVNEALDVYNAIKQSPLLVSDLIKSSKSLLATSPTSRSTNKIVRKVEKPSLA